MKRTELKRSTPLRAKSPMSRGTSTLQAKPAKEAKRRQRKCALPSCRQPFEPRSMTHKACGPVCAEAWTALEKARKLKRERQEGLAKLKPRTYWVAQAQTAFNAYIRERDKDQPCICCGATVASGDKALHGGGWDAGHYISRGHASHLRFDERNVHKQRKGCNKPGGSTRAKYRAGLGARIGEDAVLALESLEYAEATRGETVEELKGIIATYRAKLAALKKGQA